MMVKQIYKRIIPQVIATAVTGGLTGSAGWLFSRLRADQHNRHGRSTPKVYKQGLLYGKPLHLNKYIGFDELMKDLDQMFKFKGELTSPDRSWMVLYTDHEGGMASVEGGLTWKDFCKEVCSVYICRDDVQNMIPRILNKMDHRFVADQMMSPQSDTSKCKDVQFKNVDIEQLRIMKLLLDHDEPHNHVIDGVKVLSKVFSMWKLLSPKFGNDQVIDLDVPPVIHRFLSCAKVDENLSTKELLCIMHSYRDSKFASEVLLGVIELWRRILRNIELQCLDVERNNKDKPDKEVHYPFPSAVIVELQDYLKFIKEVVLNE